MCQCQVLNPVSVAGVEQPRADKRKAHGQGHAGADSGLRYFRSCFFSAHPSNDCLALCSSSPCAPQTHAPQTPGAAGHVICPRLSTVSDSAREYMCAEGCVPALLSATFVPWPSPQCPLRFPEQPFCSTNLSAEFVTPAQGQVIDLPRPSRDSDPTVDLAIQGPGAAPAAPGGTDFEAVLASIAIRDLPAVRLCFCPRTFCIPHAPAVKVTYSALIAPMAGPCSRDISFLLQRP